MPLRRQITALCLLLLTFSLLAPGFANAISGVADNTNLLQGDPGFKAGSMDAGPGRRTEMRPSSAALSANVPTAPVAMDLPSPTQTSSAATPLAGAVKWHPGHYVTLAPFASDGPGYFNEVLDEISRYPALRGVQKRYMWADLETKEGTYDFSEIEYDLARLAARDKRLVILLQTKSFKTSVHASPAYLRTAKYEDGEFAINVKGRKGAVDIKAQTGTNIKLWNPHVRDRLAALMNALGERFNSHPHLEAVALTETAFGQPATFISGGLRERFYDNLLTVDREMRRAFPNTVTLQFINFPRSILKDFIGGLAEAGVGLGGPDIFLEEHGLLNGVYPYYPRLAGTIPLAPSVQHENYYTRRHGGAPDAPSVEELYRFARDELKANYLFWTRRLVPPEKPYARVLEMLSSPAFPQDPAGGLNTACPKAFQACVN